MGEITITLHEEKSKGRYVALVSGASDVGEMTFSRASKTLIIVDHTEVPVSLRGKGVGVALAQRVVDDARAKNDKIVPLCPFFKATALKHEDWADVVEF